MKNNTVTDRIGSMSSSNPFADINPGVWVAVVVVAFIITIIVFATLVEKKKAPKSRFLKWLREFLNFRSVLIAGLIKFFYLFLATIVTLAGFVVMFMGKDEMVLPMVGIGFAIIVFGNILLRLATESMMIMIGLWENTNDMRAVMVKDEEMLEEKVTKEKLPEKPLELEKPAQPEASVKPEESVKPMEPNV